MINFLKTIVYCTLLFSTAIFSAPAVWNGSADVSWYEEGAQAYNLINAEQLAGLAKLVNEGTSDFEGKTITLGANIFLNDTTGAGDSSWSSKSHRTWTPIGTASHPFKGEFDGIAGKNNRKIYGLYINNPTSDYMGFFGYASNVKISNLDIFVGEIIGKNRAGSLVGYAAGGTITNVHTEVDVNGNNSVGGIVGYFTGNISKSSEIGSVVGQDSVGGLAGFITGAISGTATSNSFFVGKASGRKYIGGLAGLGKSISYSYSESSVEGQSDYIGGLVGFATAVISNSSHSNGIVSGANYVGGLVGSTSSFVEDSYSKGNVIARGNYVGGLMGYCYHVSKTSVKTYIARNSFSIGDVSGNDNVGGIAGFDSLWVVNIHRSLEKSYATGRVSGNNYVGGIIGNAKKIVSVSTADTGRFFIDSSYHIDGAVLGLSDDVGGIAGKFDGDVLNSYNVGSVKGRKYVGGIVGEHNRAKTKIDNSYSIGDISGVGYVGGIAGNSVEITNTYAEGVVKADSNYVGGLAGRASRISKSYHINGDVEGFAYIGGLAGSCDSIVSSHSEGSVSGLNNYVGGLVGVMTGGIDFSYHAKGDVVGKEYVGGVAGYSKNLGLLHYISNSYHEKGSVSGISYIGGLIGAAELPVNNSHSEGNVTGTGNCIGGLIGRFYTKSDTLKTSANAFNVVAKSYSLGNIDGRDYVGGLIGNFYRSVKTTGASIEDSSSIRNSYFIGNVRGQNFIGGLIGNVEMYKQLSRNRKNGIDTTTYTGSLYPPNMPATIKRHSALIKYDVINCNSKGSVEGENNVGGLIGRQVAHSDSSDKYISDSFIAFKVLNSSHSDGSVVGKDYVGGLIGVSLGAVDTAFHMNGNVSGYSYAGGLIGQAVGPVTKSFSEGNVSGTGNKVGGLIGFTSNSIKDSYSMGSVLGNDSIGGLAGYVGGPITNSYATASFVKGQNSVGGLVGYAQDLLKSCYFEGDSAIGIYQVGGLAGYVKKSVENSYSSVYVKGDDNVGGLIGSAYGSIFNSYAIGNVDGDVEHSSAGNDNLGGLVGYQYGGSISKSLALGDVSGTTKLGGLVGRFEGTSISQSYANGNVTGDYYGDPADEVGNYYIGGLVGYAKGSLAEVYASGSVKGIEDGPVYTGCIVGYVNGSLDVSKSYYDKTKCDLGIDGGENAVTVTGSPEKTTAEMQMQSTFVDWDFTNTWKIMEGTYPFLLIYANSIANAVVSTESLDGFVYDGNEKAPSVTSVSLFGETLILGTDYTVSYTNNVNAGDATIKVCGAGSYNGCKNILFEIKPIAITPTIAEIANVTFNGNEQKPSITVYNGESLLDANSYSVIYSSNVNAGIGEVEISLIGNYSGSAQSEFVIEKATPVIKTIPVASDLTLGETLASAVLSGGIADVEGNFVWKDATVVPSLENEGFEVIFTPLESENYKSSEPMIVPVTVIEKVMVIVKVGSLAIEEVLIPKGTSYTLPPSQDSVGYDFVGWYSGDELLGSAGTSISIVQDIEISAKYTLKKYFITFTNYDGTSLLKTAVDYGAVPDYIGETPTRPTTAKYTYSFAKWSPSIVKVSGEATYTAVYDSVVNEYVVTFVDEDGSVLKTSSVSYGVKPVAPSNPSKESSAQYTYSFAGWSPTITTVTGKTTYKATYSATVNSYTVSFVDADGRTLKMSSVAYGAKPIAPTNPTKSSTEKYNYTFAKWDPAIVSVTGEATYRAVYDSSDVIYVVKFANYDGTILQSSGLQYNELPKYSGKDPSRPSTAQYTYTFVGWDSEIAKVTKSVTYKAIYDSTVNEYAITFVDEDGSVLKISPVAYGVKPVAPSNPTKESSAQYTYSFAGWSPTITTVTGKTTYKATYSAEVNSYMVTFIDDDGRILKQSSVAYGVKPTTPATPTKSSTEKYNYTFAGWSPAIEDVTSPATYTALFDSILNNYSITFKNGAEILQSTSIAYGSKPEYKGIEPTKTASAKYNYTFAGWYPAIEDVTGPATYTALFDSTLNNYSITFKNGAETLLSTTVTYGTKPEYKGTEPTKTASAKYNYTFAGWNPAIENVTGPATYTALFDSTLNNYTVVFMNGTTVLQNSFIAYGEVPEYKGAEPSRKATDKYSFKFTRWSPAIELVTKNTTYEAIFDSTEIVKSSSSSNPGSSSSEKIESSSSSELNTLAATSLPLRFRLSVVGRNIQIAGASVGTAYALLDMQGRIVYKGSVSNTNFSVSVSYAGSYLMKIGNQIQRANVK